MMGPAAALSNSFERTKESHDRVRRVGGTSWTIYNPCLVRLCGKLSPKSTANTLDVSLSILLQHKWRKEKEKSVLSLPLLSQIQAAGERLQLLLSQPLLLLQVLLPYEQRGLGLDEAPVVLQLLGRQLTGQEGGDHVLSPVQVILQIFGVLPLFAQQTVAAVQRLLSAETEL